MQQSIDTRWYGLEGITEFVNLQSAGFREYQFNIARKIFYGKNTLVILPTGLGKTLIGVLAMGKAIQNGKKALFLSPTKPLSEQHYSTLKEYLNIDEERVLLLTGALERAKRKQMVEFAKVIVATPQTVANEMKKGDIDIADFGIVVFDECHKAVGKYAYTYIADECDLKGVQMLGLTASPGSSKEKVKALTSALKIKEIEIRISTDSDVAPYVMPKYMHVVEVDKSPLMVKITGLLRPLAEDSLRKLKNMGLTQFGNFEVMPKGRLIELGNMIGKIQAQNFKFGALYQYVRLLNMIHAYDLLETEGLYSFSSYIETLKAKERIGKAVQSIIDDKNVIVAKRLADEGMKDGDEHPKAFTLIGILKESPAKSAIVFAQYRSSIKMITDLLNANGISARAFVGKKEGITQAQQQMTISDFRNGKFRVLVSSSIGEEGLDIPNVDVVVFYEPIASEIRNIQRRGRTGRLYSGDVYLLVTRGTKDQIYLLVSRQREKKMFEVVSKLKGDLKAKQDDTASQKKLL